MENKNFNSKIIDEDVLIEHEVIEEEIIPIEVVTNENVTVDVINVIESCDDSDPIGEAIIDDSGINNVDDDIDSVTCDNEHNENFNATVDDDTQEMPNEYSNESEIGDNEQLEQSVELSESNIDSETIVVDESSEESTDEKNNSSETENHEADVKSHDINKSKVKGADSDKPKNKNKKAKKKSGVFKKAVKALSTCFIWLLCFSLMYVCFSNLYQMMFNSGGYTGFFDIGQAIVASDSMVPTMTKNDLIFYRGTSTDSELNVGDIVVYKTTQNGNEILIVHRISEVTGDYVTTQGDANAQADKPIEKTQVVGKYLFRIPMIGFLLNILNAKFAPIAFVALVTVVFSIRMAVYLTRKKKLLKSMSKNEETRAAINHFFDI